MYWMQSNALFLQVIKNPVSDHLPAGAKKLVMSFKADVIDAKKLIPEDEPVVLIVGSMAHGSVSCIQDIPILVSLSMSQYTMLLLCRLKARVFSEFQGQHAFCYIGPITWNSLPFAVHHAQTLRSFKSQLKT